MSKQETKTEILYRFEELSDSAKDTVRGHLMREYNWAGEAMDSLNALAAHFGGRISDWSIDWANADNSRATFSMPDTTYAEAKRLLSELGEFNPKTLKGLGDCKLTGVCHDEDCIDGAREWLFAQPVPAPAEDDENEEAIDLAEMMEEAFTRLTRSCERDYESQGEDEQVSESCEANDYWFTEDGQFA